MNLLAADRAPLVAFPLGVLMIAGGILLSVLNGAGFLSTGYIATGLLLVGPPLAVLSYQAFKWTRGLDWAMQAAGRTAHFWLRSMAAALGCAALALLLLSLLAPSPLVQARIALGALSGALLCLGSSILLPARLGRHL